MLAVTRDSNVALWNGKNTTKTGKVFPAKTQFEYLVQDGTWFQIASGPFAGFWMNAGSNWQYIQIVTTPPPPVEQKVLTNLIHVYDDGSIDVIPQ